MSYINVLHFMHYMPSVQSYLLRMPRITWVKSSTYFYNNKTLCVWLQNHYTLLYLSSVYKYVHQLMLYYFYVASWMPILTTVAQTLQSLQSKHGHDIIHLPIQHSQRQQVAICMDSVSRLWLQIFQFYTQVWTEPVAMKLFKSLPKAALK